MKVKLTKLADALLFVWQLPQHLLGLLLVWILRPEQDYPQGDGRTRLYYASRMRGGISLGRYIILSERLKDYTGQTEKHEWGHSRQSILLGPLYLFVIGIPSILWAAWWNTRRGVSYYAFYTEAWADKLGGVERC